MKKKDYNQHHSHKTLKHQVDTKKPKNKKLKKIFWLVLILIIIFLIIFLIFNTSLFKIKKISITGTLNSDLINLTESDIKNYLNNNFNNILFLNKNNLKKYILENIKLEKLEIKKKLFNKLEIEIAPEMPKLLWQKNKEYFLINKQGIVETQINLVQLEWELPIVSYNTSTEIIINKKLVPDNFLQFIPEFNKEFRNINNIKINNYIIQNFNGREVWAYTDQGWYIILNTNNNIKIIVNNLKNLIEQKFKDEQPQEYIDLRIEDKIFYK